MGTRGLVAVASSGLFPQPLWISVCSLRRQAKTITAADRMSIHICLCIDGRYDIAKIAKIAKIARIVKRLLMLDLAVFLDDVAMAVSSEDSAKSRRPSGVSAISDAMDSSSQN